MFFPKDRSRDRFMKTAYPHLDFVFSVAFRLSGNRYDAEDLTQEAFVIAFQKLHQLKDPEKCKPWLLSILRNLYLRSQEKNRPGLLKVQDDEEYSSILENLVREETPEDIFAEKNQFHEVQKILNSLPEKYKTPLILHYTEEWSYKEIAQGLDLPMGTVMSRIGRGRELIKKELIRRQTPRERGQVITPVFARGSRKG